MLIRSKLYMTAACIAVLTIAGIPHTGIPATVMAVGADAGADAGDTAGEGGEQDGSSLDGIGTEASTTETDMNYDGPIDMFDRSPIPEDGGQDQTQRVNISDGSVYDRTTGMYIYSVDNGAISVSVADGMMVTGEVTFAKGEEADAQLYKDGELLAEFPQVVNAPGSYAVITGGDESTGQVMGFRILNQVTGVVNQYNLPRGFSVRSVTINGEDAVYDYGVVDMTQEGVYNIGYICSDNGVTYNLTVMVDHTPPQVTFEGLDENNKAKGPVTLTGLEKGDSVSIISGDEVKKLNMKSQITESGDYRVVVSDQAGNTVEKEFKIMVYLNVQSWMLFGFIFLLIVGLAIALTITRKKLRVR